jgi:hypothetical protein
VFDATIVDVNLLTIPAFAAWDTIHVVAADQNLWAPSGARNAADVRSDGRSIVPVTT